MISAQLGRCGIVLLEVTVYSYANPAHKRAKEEEGWCE
jgi:hypothetical protein